MVIINIDEERKIAEAGKLAVVEVFLALENFRGEIGDPGVRRALNIAGVGEDIVTSGFEMNRLRQAITIGAANRNGLGTRRREHKPGRLLPDEHEGLACLKVSHMSGAITGAANE